MTASEAPAAIPLRLAGRAVLSGNDQIVPNPADLEEVVGSIALATSDHVNVAVHAAMDAFPRWRDCGAVARSAVLSSTADAIRTNHEQWSGLLSREHGKTVVEARAELSAAEQILRYYSSLSSVVDDEKTTSNDRGTMIVRRQAMGPTAVLVPWNYPAVLAMLMIAPALMAGNTVVVKLPEHSPLTLALILAEMVDAVPVGTLSVLAGSGEDVGAPLVAHSGIRKVMFTGSTETGRRIMAAASPGLKSLSLELGGNDAAIVMPDADLEFTARELALGAFTCAGQVCYAPKRIYVHRSKIDAFVDEFARASSGIVVGDGGTPGVSMGPVNNEAQYKRLQSLLDEAKAAGADIRELGQWPEQLAQGNGYFIRPTLVLGLSEDHPLVAEEQFGPIVPVQPFDHEEDVIRTANESEYGLAASIWSRDTDRAFDLARRLESGTVFVNVHRVGASDPSMPFGGFKQSGLGRGHGVVALEDCMELQVLAERCDMTGGIR